MPGPLISLLISLLAATNAMHITRPNSYPDGQYTHIRNTHIVKVAVDDPIILNCTTSSGEVYWSCDHDNEEVRERTILFQYPNASAQGMIIVLNANTSDSGVYTCTHRLGAFEYTKHFKVTVEPDVEEVEVDDDNVSHLVLLLILMIVAFIGNAVAFAAFKLF